MFYNDVSPSPCPKKIIPNRHSVAIKEKLSNPSSLWPVADLLSYFLSLWICLLLVPCIWGPIQYLTICVRLISLKHHVFKVHVVACPEFHSFLTPVLCVYTTCPFICLMDNWVIFHLLAIVNTAAICCTGICIPAFNSFGYS